MENLVMILEIQKSLKQLEISGHWLRWEKKAERSLTHKLKELFKITFDRTFLKLREMIFVPSSDIQRKQLLFEIEELREKFKEIISESAIESVDIGKERVLLLVDTKTSKKEMHLENLIVKQAIIEVPLMKYSEQFKRLIQESIFVASEATMDRMMGDIMENLTESYVQGLGVGETANRLKIIFDSIEDYRLLRIARTEINSYQNLGSHHTCIDLGVQYEQWWSARDERVRSSHAYLHSQIVRTGDNFSNGLEYPGDRNGPIEEWIQCRCRLVPFLMPFGYMAPIGAPYFYEGDLIESKLVEEPEIFARGHIKGRVSQGEAEKILQNDAKRRGVELSEMDAMDKAFSVHKFTETAYYHRAAQREYLLTGDWPEGLSKETIARIYDVEDFIEYSPNYPKDQIIFRGLDIEAASLTTRDKLRELKTLVEGSVIEMGGTSSWTSNPLEMRKFAGVGEDSVGFILKGGSKYSASIAHISQHPEEVEALISVNSKFKVVQSPKYANLDAIFTKEEISEMLHREATYEVIHHKISKRWWIILEEV